MRGVTPLDLGLTLNLNIYKKWRVSRAGCSNSARCAMAWKIRHAPRNLSTTTVIAVVGTGWFQRGCSNGWDAALCVPEDSKYVHVACCFAPRLPCSYAGPHQTQFAPLKLRTPRAGRSMSARRSGYGSIFSRATPRNRRRDTVVGS